MRGATGLLAAVLVGTLQLAETQKAGQAIGRKNEAYCLKVPFENDDNQRWEMGAGASAEQDFIRLTPAEPSRTGYLWSRIPNSIMTDWQTTIEFKISGEQTGGGEGFAFWYVEKRMLGSVFGSADYWNGLGVFFDTYNNDRKGQSPMIAGIYNDGSQAYSSYDDGLRQAFGSCHAPYLRNRNQNSFVRITYVNNKFTLEIAFNSNGGVPSYQQCFVRDNIELGQDKFFGITASTGQPLAAGQGSQIADNHDLFTVTTYDLSPANAKEESRKRRENYRREVEESHSQMPDYHETEAKQFKHDVIALLRQVEGAVQVLDQSQLSVKNMIEANHKTDLKRDSVLKNTDATKKKVANRETNDLTKLAEQILASQETLKKNLDASAGSSTTYPVPVQNKVNEITRNYATMNEEVKALKLVVQQSINEKGRDPSANAETAVKNALASKLTQFQSKQQKLMNEIADDLRSMEAIADDLNNALNGPRKQASSSGMGWFSTLLLTVLFIEVVAMVALQQTGKLPGLAGDYKRGKFV